MQNRLVDFDGPDGALVPGAWRAGKNLADTRPENLPGPNRDYRVAKAQRNLIMEWCSSPAGRVPWQDNMLLV